MFLDGKAYRKLFFIFLKIYISKEQGKDLQFQVFWSKCSKEREEGQDWGKRKFPSKRRDRGWVVEFTPWAAAVNCGFWAILQPRVVLCPVSLSLPGVRGGPANGVTDLGTSCPSRWVHMGPNRYHLYTQWALVIVSCPQKPKRKGGTTGLIFKHHHPSKEGVIITPFKHQGVCFSGIITGKCVHQTHVLFYPVLSFWGQGSNTWPSVQWFICPVMDMNKHAEQNMRPSSLSRISLRKPWDGVCSGSMSHKAKFPCLGYPDF